jgi:hypothetical protein
MRESNRQGHVRYCLVKYQEEAFRRESSRALPIQLTEHKFACAARNIGD